MPITRYQLGPGSWSGEEDMSIETRKAVHDRTLQIVSQHMARLGVSGLPRNYELFHEAHSGADASLSREVLSLPVGPTQALLDEIGLRHQLSTFVALASPKSRNHEIKLLLELRDKMLSGVSQKQGFARVLEAVARSLREDSQAGPDDILSEIEYLSVSLSDAVVAEAELETTLKQGADRLIQAERNASAARAITLRDRLTSLPNHAALADHLDMLYASPTEGYRSALFLVTIPQLPAMAQTYGEQAVNRIIKKIAAIFRKAIKKHDMVARIGTADFALLLKDVDGDSVRPIAERLVSAVGDNLVFAASHQAGATVDLAVGIALARDAFSPHQLRLHATAALEASKANNRPAVFVADDVPR